MYIEYFYNVYSRLISCIGVFLILLPSLAGKGRLIRFFLGNKIMIVLGRLSFCIYLLHILILCVMIFGREYGYFISN